MDTKNSTGYYIIRDYRSYLKPFEQRSSVDITMTPW